jgi:hypothetical protein
MSTRAGPLVGRPRPCHHRARFGRDRTIVAEDLDDPAAAMAAVDAHIATRDARGTQQRRMPGTRSHRHHARRAPERRLEGSARASPTAGWRARFAGPPMNGRNGHDHH